MGLTVFFASSCCLQAVAKWDSLLGTGLQSNVESGFIQHSSARRRKCVAQLIERTLCKSFSSLVLCWLPS
jgi:hypothetical protein